LEFTSPAKICKVGVAYGPESELYSFPGGHPLNNSRTKLFFAELSRLARDNPKHVFIEKPVLAEEEDLLLFHYPEYIDLVKRYSKLGEGYLDYGDTPSYRGVYEAALYTVGSTLDGLERIFEGKVDHFFNPVGGLHHARRERAGGFCVFNDCSIAIISALKKKRNKELKRVAYVDIDAHHGDGVYYGLEDDPRVIIGDIHEDGRYLYPGTGFASETGKGDAKGTKLNIPLPPESGDEAFFEAFDRVAEFISESEPSFIFFQCGADGLDGDPITHLHYSPSAHAYAAKKLHELAHEVCEGRLIAMGGGGYNPENVRDAWMVITKEFCCENPRAD
jgi:acetoin utilization protein AcuC